MTDRGKQTVKARKQPHPACFQVRDAVIFEAAIQVLRGDTP